MESRTKDTEFPIPFDVYRCLTGPLRNDPDGLEVSDNRRQEKLKIPREALGQLDYLLGTTLSDSYNWKERSFALHGKSVVDSITFTYFLEKHVLHIETVQKYN